MEHKAKMTEIICVMMTIEAVSIMTTMHGAVTPETTAK